MGTKLGRTVGPHLGRRRWASICFVGVVVLTIVPWTWNYPTAGLDAAWRMSINRAVVDQLAFGRDIVFTYGPFGVVSTTSYDPSLRWMAVLGGTIMAGGLLLVAVPLLRRATPLTGLLAGLGIVLTDERPTAALSGIAPSTLRLKFLFR